VPFLVLVLVGLVASLAVGCAGGRPTYVYVDGGDGCPADQHKDTTGACVAGPALECEPGSMKVLGEDTCTPIGWNECGDGFAKDPSGWGCREVVAASCSGATRAALGSSQCVPVGECNAPFPPPDATLFVSATGPDTGNKFRSLYAAVLSARSGDVIAVDSGVYRESTQFDRQVTIVGRCPEKVIIDGSSVRTPGFIVHVPTTVRGVTLRRFRVGIQGSAGITLEDSVVESNDDAGIYLEGRAITGRLARSVIRNTKAVSLPTAFGVDLVQGVTMDVIDSEITASQGAGVIVAPGSKLTMRSSVVRGSTADLNGVGGFGINGQGGDAIVEGSAFIDNAEAGIRAYKGSVFTVERSVIRGTKPGSAARGHGVIAADRGKLTISKVVIAETEGVGVACFNAVATLTDSVVRGQKPAPDGDFGDGVYVFGAGTLSLTRVAVLDNARAGADVFDAKTEASFDHVLISGTKPLPKGDMGLGLAVGFGGHAKVDATVISGHHHTGIYAFDGSTLDMTRSAVRDTAQQLAGVPLGHGVLVTDSTHVVIADSEIRRSAAVGIAFANTAALISRSVVADCSVGIHVQDGSTLLQVDSPSAAPSGRNVEVTADCRFEGNATRIGSGTVPLPDPLAPAKL
jgi:hypothetical protein